MIQHCLIALMYCSTNLLCLCILCNVYIKVIVYTALEKMNHTKKPNVLDCFFVCFFTIFALFVFIDNTIIHETCVVYICTDLHSSSGCVT